MKVYVKSLFQVVSTLAVTLTAVGCSQGPKQYNQVQWANEFVQKLNTNESGEIGHRYQVVKAVASEPGYMVFLDTKSPSSYISVKIDNYSYGSNAQKYLESENKIGQAYYNLRPNGDGTYTHVNSDGSDGPTFSVSAASAPEEKDLRKVKAVLEQAQIDSISEKLMADYGFSNPEDSARAARTLVAYSDTMSKREMRQADLDNLTTEIAGFSVTEAMQAYQSGDQAKINQLLKQANDKGIGSSPEEAKAAVAKMLSSF